VLVLKVLGVIVGFAQLYLLYRLFCWAAIHKAEQTIAENTKPKRLQQPAREDEPYDGDEFAGVGVVAFDFEDDDTFFHHL